MSLPPSIVHVRVVPARGWMPGLWLPLFLIWPVVLVLLLPLFVLGLCLALVVQARAVPRLVAFFGGVYALLCELRGIRVDVRGAGSQVFISIF
jgi:hypothetical protein